MSIAIATVLAAESEFPSLTLNVKKSTPGLFALKVTTLLLRVATPLLGVDTILYVRVSPSGSTPARVYVSPGLPKVALTLWPVAVGLSLTGVIETLIVAGAESSVPSLALKVNESEVAVSLEEVYMTKFPDPVTTAVPWLGAATIM